MPDEIVERSQAGLAADLKSKLVQDLAAWTKGLSKLKKEEAPQVYQMAEKVKKLGEEIKDAARDLIVEAALGGEQVTDKGTMQAQMGSDIVRAIPLKTGTDPSKLERMLIAKGKDPGVAMDATISYRLNPEKLLKAIEAGHLTAEDVRACAYEPSYRVEVRRG